MFKKINTVFENLFGYVGIAMILIATYAVLARTVLAIPATWTDEVLKMLFVWSIFTCAGLAFYKRELIGLDLIMEKLRNRPFALGIVKILQNIIALLFAVLTIIFAINIIRVQLMTGESTTVVGLPLWFINLGFLIGNILIGVFAAIQLFEDVKNLKKEQP